MKLYLLLLLWPMSIYARESKPCLDGLWVYKNYAGNIIEATRIVEETSEIFICYLSTNGYVYEKNYRGEKPRSHVIRINGDFVTHYIHNDADDTVAQVHELDFGVYSDALTRATTLEQYSVYRKGCLFEAYYKRYDLWDEL